MSMMDPGYWNKTVDYVMDFLEENGLHGLFSRESVSVMPLYYSDCVRVAILESFNYEISREIASHGAK